MTKAFANTGTMWGKSDLRFHGGLEVSVGGGEPRFQWGLARSTKEEAVNASYGMREGWELADRTHREMMTTIDAHKDLARVPLQVVSQGSEKDGVQ